VEVGNQRLVLDVGRPLSAERNESVPLPDITGLSDGDPSLRGVVITHAHQDHWGLVEQIPLGVPLFMGEATHNILKEAAFWTTGFTVEPAGFLVHRQSLELGPFRITPFLNDHSAFDAYALLVEAGGRRLFYTGDIRGHGRKRGIFEELLRKPPEGVDVLLMEGTNIRSDFGPAEAQVTEDELEVEMAETMKSTEGMVLAISSAQNIDRLVTLYRAAKRSGRDLVIDLYGASIARATGNANIPQPGDAWPTVHVYVPRWQRVKVKESEQFHRVEEIKPHRVYEKYLADNRSKLVMLFSLNSGVVLAKASALVGATAIWSLWSGYLKEASGERLLRFLGKHDIPMVQQHTSGHASIPDLQRLATALNPGKIVPIHSFAGGSFTDHFENVTVEPDGAWWEV
jgi:ribonuclease J